MSKEHGNTSATFNCPHCGINSNKTLEWLRDNEVYECSCGNPSRLDDSEFAASNQALANLSQFIAGPRGQRGKV